MSITLKKIFNCMNNKTIIADHLEQLTAHNVNQYTDWIILQ